MPGKFSDTETGTGICGAFGKYYVRMNEMILRRRVENAALYYRFVRRERMRLFHDYIKHLPAYRSVAA